MDQYGMKLIAYTEARNFYIHIDLREKTFQKKGKQKDFDRLLSQYSNRGIRRRSPFFARIGSKISELFRMPEEDIRIVNILPLKTADYLAWKEISVCRKLGYDPGMVTSCLGIFEKNKDGIWILMIKELRLKSGRVIPVQDFVHLGVRIGCMQWT
jgi:hypothetical protein